MTIKRINNYLILIFLVLCWSCKKEEVAPLPKANFYAEVKKCVNDTCTVYFYDSSNNAISWVWDFGNGQQSSKPNDSTTYNLLGNYTVTLKIKNLDAIEDIKTKTVQL